MLVALNPTSSVTLICVMLLTLSCGQTITQLNSLANLRVSQSEDLYLDLYKMISGPNLTFSISGSYSPSLPSSDVKIYQNLHLAYNTSKKISTNQMQSYGGLQIDFYRKLLYTIENNNITLWDLENFPALVKKTSYAIMVDPGYTVVSIQLINFRVVPGKALQRFGFTIDFKGSTYYMRVLNFTDTNNITEIVSLQQFRLIPSFSRATFYQDTNYVWAFLYTQDEILVYRFTLTGTMASTYMYSITKGTLNSDILTPISLSFFGGKAYYCDETLGVYEVSLEYINSTVANFPVTQSLRAPSSIGDIVSCTINRGILTVDTSAGTALYSLPSFQQIISFPHYDTYATTDNYGMSSNGELTVGWVNSVVSSSAVRSSFRVFSSKMTFLNSLLIDIDANVLLGGDSSNINPAFVMYQPISSDSIYVIINAAKSLIVYEIEKGSFLHFPAQYTPYTYTGSLIANDGANSKAFPVYLQGVAGNSTTIFSGRGHFDGSDYPHPTSFANYVFSLNNSVFTTYIPINNYFDGPNLTYDLSIIKGTNNFDELAIYTPDKITKVSEKKTQSQNLDLSSFQVISLGLGRDFIINLNEDVLAVYLYEGLQEINYFVYDFPTTLTTALITAQDVGQFYIIVESTGIDSSFTYFVEWSIFKCDLKSMTLVSSIVMANRDPSSQIFLTHSNLFYSLSGDSIDIFELQTSPSVTLVYVSSINSTTFESEINFTPVSFGIFDKLYVFDYYLGLIYIQEANGTESYSYFKSDLIFPNSFDVTIQGDEEFIYLTVRTFNNSNIYLVPKTLEYFDILPVVHCDIPSGFSVSDLYYSQVCTTGGLFYIQIFDAYESLFAALFTEIYPGATGFFALGSRINFNSVTGYYTDGSVIYAYNIGQLGNSSFNPTYPTEVQPITDLSQTIWTQITLTFKDVYYVSTYNFKLKLYVWNSYHSAQTNLDITLYNSRNYISQNLDYNNSNSNFTSGYINLFKNDFVAPIPTDSFKGNNIEYAFQINGTMDNLVLASESCTGFKTFCLENKTYSVISQPGEFTYFDHYNDSYVVTNTSHVMLYTLNFNKDYVSSSSFTLKQSMNTSKLDEHTSCYQVTYLPNHNGYAMACTTIKTTGTFYFIVILGSDFSACSSNYYISYPVKFLKTAISEGKTWVYFFESVQISILQLENTTSSQTCKFNFSVIGHITQNSLLTNKNPFSPVASSFKPIDMYYYKPFVWIMIDEVLGLVFIEQSRPITPPYLYFVGAIVTPTTNILQVKNSKIISSAFDTSGQGTILLIMDSADVYKCALYPYPRIQVHYPKIFETGFVPANKGSDIIIDSTTLVFPVIKGELGYIRFLNYSSDATSAIFKDRLFGIYDNNTYNQRVEASSTMADLVIHNFNPVSIFDSGGPLHVFGYRPHPKGYVKKSTAQYNGTLAMVGYVGSEYAQYIPVSYIYPTSKSGSGSGSSSNPLAVHTYRSEWNRWYFWFIFSVFALVLVASIVSVYVCISRRKNRAYSHLEIGLTTVNP